MSRIRAFVGVPLPEAVIDALASVRRELADADPFWRGEKWVVPENLHVTLKFVGEMDPEAADALGASLETVVARHPAFELAITGIRAVPALRRASMLWLALADPTGACAALAAQVERACLPFGARPDERAFAPHVTLVRSRRSRPVSADAIALAGEALGRIPDVVSVRSANLYSSELTRQGPMYSVLRSCELRRV